MEADGGALNGTPREDDGPFTVSGEKATDLDCLEPLHGEEVQDGGLKD